MKIETKIKGIMSSVVSIVENQISYSYLNLQRIIANGYALLNIQSVKPANVYLLRL